MPTSPLSVLREACLQMGKEELCGNDDVVKDNQVTAEAVGGAELCQHQMHLVHARRRGREGRIKVFRTNILTMTVVWTCFSQTNKVINILKNCETSPN